MEIVYIFSIKFTPADAYRNDKKLKKDYQECTHILVENATSVLSEELNVEFDKGYSLVFVFPPSVHEFIKAFELSEQEEKQKRSLSSTMSGIEYFTEHSENVRDTLPLAKRLSSESARLKHD